MKKKIIKIGEASYKSIADKSIDAGKFTDGAFEELVNSILPQKIDETIENKISKKSEEIDDTLTYLLKHEKLAVVSEDVKNITIVTQEMYEAMYEKNCLDDKTLYCILEE